MAEITHFAAYEGSSGNIAIYKLYDATLFSAPEGTVMKPRNFCKCAHLQNT
jgi:hypothetical protein